MLKFKATSGWKLLDSQCCQNTETYINASDSSGISLFLSTIASISFNFLWRIPMAQKLNARWLFLLVKWHIKCCRSNPQTRSWGNCPGNQTCAWDRDEAYVWCASVHDPIKHAGTQWKALPLLGGTCKAKIRIVIMDEIMLLLLVV